MLKAVFDFGKDVVFYWSDFFKLIKEGYSVNIEGIALGHFAFWLGFMAVAALLATHVAKKGIEKKKNGVVQQNIRVLKGKNLAE